MSDDEYDTHCPLCVEEMDLSDQNFLPCPCGYKVCMWCWHHIRENMNGLCPACRTPYNSDPHAFSAVDREDIVKLKKEKRQKEKQEKKTAERVIVATPGVQVKSTASTVMDRKHLHNYRVVQRNLVYVIGVPAAYASEDTLRKPEFFGQYGKIGKVVIHRNHSSAHSTVSVYVTFTYKEDARASIQSLDGHWLDQNHLLRASFGTTKYCNNFIRGVPCNNPECVYLHDLGDDDDRFTKEEIQAGHSKIPPVPGKDQTLVTGGGGPSGTGKRPLGEPYLPPPVFIQDNYPSSTPMVPTPVPVAAPPVTTTASSTLAAPPGVGVGIVMGVGRPAAVSRSGTATWGTANTIAAIIGGDASAVSGALMSLTDRERDRPRSNSNTPVNFPPLSLSTATSSNNLQEEVYRAGGSSSVPTAALKRSTSNTVSVSALDPTPAGAAVSAAAARTAPIAPPTSTANTSNASTSNTSSTTTTTPAAATTAASTATSTTTTTSSAAATTTPAAPAAVVAPAKPKAKTQKEINAEKKAAAAAARAAEKALMAEAAAAAAAERAALAAAAMAAGGDGESKSNGSIVPTPKLSAKQQMLANKAEKAAKAQAAALAAQEVREAARLLRETARAAAQAERSTNKEETKPQSRAERKAHQAALALAAAQNAAAAASSSPVAAPATPATPVQANDTQDLSILTQVAAPSIVNAPLPSLSSMTDAPPTYAQVRGFNGLSVNTLFPVPASSLSCSVWGNILRATNEDLLINPYGQLKVPMSELLDLMLPPVDAMLSSAPCWPRPLAYYSQGMQPGGVTFSPAGKHVHVRSAADMAALPPMVQMLPPSLQSASIQGNSGRHEAPSLTPAQLAAQAQQHSRVNMLLSAISAESSEPEPVMPPMPSLPVLVPATASGVPLLGPPPGVALPGSSTTAGGYVRSNGRTAGPSPLGPPPGVSVSGGSAGSAGNGGNGGGASINALRQLFPGVKMSVSASK